MPYDPIRVADTRAWLVKAADDLRGAEIDLAAEPPLLGDVLFHCQQAVEKVLKAFLTWHDRPFRKTHDLVETGERCVEIDATLEPLLHLAAPLTEYAWKFRYPGDVTEPTQAETEASLSLARQVADAVISRIPDFPATFFRGVYAHLPGQAISPVRVSPNGRYFVDPAGHPVFWLGDTQWELFRLFTPEGALRILRDRQGKGFNIILIMLLGVNTSRFKKDDRAPYTNREGEVPWVDSDPARPNERYFEHIDAMVRLGEQTGQTFVVGVYHQWQVDVITVEKARAWAQWVARRYRDVPNLIWSMYPKATSDYIPVCRELAAGLLAGDGGAHLISVHPDPAVASSSFIHDEPWLAFNMIQTCTRYEQIPDAVMADYARTPVKPVVMAEGGYEGLEFRRMQTAHHIRKQAYWSQLAGGHHVYGHNDHWTAPLDWAKWLDSPGSRHLRVFQEAMTSIDGWWDLAPDASILASGAGSGDQANLAARSAEGQWIAVYLSEASTVSVRLDAVTAGDRVRAWWIDPTCGDRRPAGSFVAQGTQSFTSPPAWEDALLYVAV